jgi:uncharacterized protein (TIGR02145 family)
MDRNLGAGQVATSSADVNSYGDLYQWGRFADGHQCKNSATTSTISSSYNPGHGNFILAFSDWLNPENPDLWSGAEGINNPCPTGYRVPTDVELEVELESWGSLDSDGAFASPLKLSMAGYRSNVNGGVYDEGINGFNWSSTANLTYGRYFFFGDDYAQLSSGNRAYGFSVRCMKEDGSPSVPTVGTIPVTNITQTSATSGGSITDDGGAPVTARGVVWGLTQFPNIQVNDGITFDGEGLGTYISQLTDLTPQTFYYIRAYATNSGGTRYGNQDVFVTSPLVVGEYPPGFVHCETPTAVVDVTNPTTGKTWMDRNLGAANVAEAIDDENSYGDLYQWGRFADGHQCRNSETTTTLSSTPVPGHGMFILNSSSPNNWQNPVDNTLWQGVNGINRTCPNGYRLPTEMEINAERQSWSTNNSNGAFGSPLKFSLPGLRSWASGSILATGSEGYYWTSSVIFAESYYLSIHSHSAGVVASGHSRGHSVRCIKDFIDDDD